MSLFLFQDTDYFRHALASPLTQASLNCELALAELQHLPQTTTTRHYLDTGLRHLTYVRDMIRQTDQPPQSLSVVSFIQPIALRYHQPHLGQHLFWQHSLSDQDQIVVEPLVFQEIIACLIHNSFEAYTNQTRQKHVVLLAQKIQDTLQLQVWDGGQGIQWFQQPFIFWRGLSHKKGHTGLGLALVRRVVADHRGTLNIISSKGIGTCVTLNWPLKFKSITKTSNSFNVAGLSAKFDS